MVKINFAKTEHIELISDFERQTFNAEAYSYETLSEMLTDNYLLKNNENIIVITDDDDLIGYIIFHIGDDFTDIYKIYIRDKDKKNGYGSELLSYVENLAKKLNSAKIMIEVRSNNHIARNFYKKNGFNDISIRKEYYKNPTDDAIILEKKV